MSTDSQNQPKGTAVAKKADTAPAPVTIKAKEAWEDFQHELEKRANEIGSQLPSNVSRDRFLNASIAAVKQTPTILLATPRSLFAALTKAAQDGLVPDGREGVITVFSTTVDGKKQSIAQWNPMFYGLRKRAREIDGIIIDAQVVFDGDDFEYELGDQPFIRHKPKPRAERADASAGLAVYAIFRHPTEGILHREVMWKPDVFDVMNQSRAKGSLMWTTFWTEGWKKTVGRRAAKSVPVSPALERLITRDDENFEFNRDHAALPAPARRAPSEFPDPDEETPAKPAEATTEQAEQAEPKADAFDADAFLVEIEDKLAAADTEDAIEEAWDTLDAPPRLSGEDERYMNEAFALKEKHLARVGVVTKKALEAAGQQTMFDQDDFPGDRR